ncbi:AraC family transcriptional regulator [Xanthomonas euvesicatoria pv. eucalypti]|uniref:AraC family transcriptional regulator n=1 Tax=Xanthomonas euvesicatoria TaxID=456327 RepID=UPI0026E3F314|nr:AraC family transcriptional regulator [Xanthomonas euvesicatoria]MDO7932004.1 AraC family transcriptional regulator [Xanthomonas euvesicatoria pv. eucalypti]MDO7936110.1 AraC family transcriptional regulator [Xanthomonas euvesicatoria pv. eucalypti]MDO7940375.1 AraC family transcriptional regulator [Xanthomonas euvesicatoria pv. eucalypti]MDO7944293.1 AraC family transcriptional regulator [Xanthomonas euvesicatoria pv. eucalypti]MDO7950381.1 AraC family transcriptional regulator [Xanthomona
MSSLTELSTILLRHAPGDGMHPTQIARLQIMRSAAPTVAMPTVYTPMLCLVAQGRKQAMLGAQAYVYHPQMHLVASVDLPIVGSVIQASSAQPYLCFCLDLDTAVLSELAINHPELVDTQRDAASAGLLLNRSTPQLQDAALRLARLLDRPHEIAALAPLIVRELLYRLMADPANAAVRQMAIADSRLNQISRAIVWLREHYAQRFSIEQIADLSAMSRSTFHAHFKAVTTMTPLEYRSQLRVHEARRLMVAEALTAADAGFRVGYESASQFSRDYARILGISPARDAQRLRANAQDATEAA